MDTKALTLIFLFPVFLFAQPHSIQGYLKDNNGEAVAFVTVTLKNSENKLLSFVNSTEQGFFEFKLTEAINISELYIEINYLGFKKVKVPVIAAGAHNIVLEIQEFNIQEIEIKNTTKVKKGGDTLQYDVYAFTKPSDRSIGEVIKRMPGMEVDQKGQIKYNGKSISGFYINGDNLLDDKYSIGTNAIPPEMVKTIEVLQNNQPTKVLRDKVFTDNIAINLLITPDAKTKVINQIKAGLGLPKLFDGDLTSIAFNDKIKFLNVVKSNNTGIDLSTDFAAFNFSKNLSQLGIARPSPVLVLGNVDIPPLPKQTYYFNNSGSLNLNNLVNIKDSTQLRVNVNVLKGRSNLLYQSEIDTYLPYDTVRYTEYQETTNKELLTEATFTLESNKEKSFLKYDWRTTYRDDKENSDLRSNERYMSQKLQNQIREFSNQLSFIPALKNEDILSLDWHLSYFNRTQTLAIVPGINIGVLNNDVPFNKVKQFVDIPTWTNRISLAYNFTKYIVKKTFEVGMLNEFQSLLSNLSLVQLNEEENNFQGYPGNNLKWSRQQFFVASKLQYKKERWETSLYIPATLQLINFKDPAFSLAQYTNRGLLTPSLRAKYFISAEDFLTLNYSYQYHLGNITGIYPGIILTNYRQLNANQAELQHRKQHFTALQFNRQRTTNMVFFNGGLSFHKTLANTITSTIVSNDITRTVILPIENTVESFGANWGVSKYINFVQSTAKVNLSWNTVRSENILNDLRLASIQAIFSVNSNIGAELFRQLRIELNANFRSVKSSSSVIDQPSVAGINDIHIKTYENIAKVGWAFHKNANLLFNINHTYLSQPIAKDFKYLFANAAITYRLSKFKTDLELNLTNLTNVRFFENYTTSNNIFSQSRYHLRERMILIKVIFNL